MLGNNSVNQKGDNPATESVKQFAISITETTFSDDGGDIEEQAVSGGEKKLIDCQLSECPDDCDGSYDR